MSLSTTTNYATYILDPTEVHGEDFLEGDIPRAQGEGSQAVWGVSDEKIGVGGVG